ncbi:MAG: hypothetical protein WAK17_10785 [Candidatus Nitrosopolaris sp.]
MSRSQLLKKSRNFTVGLVSSDIPISLPALAPVIWLELIRTVHNCGAELRVLISQGALS